MRDSRAASSRIARCAARATARSRQTPSCCSDMQAMSGAASERSRTEGSLAISESMKRACSALRGLARLRHGWSRLAMHRTRHRAGRCDARRYCVAALEVPHRLRFKRYAPKTAHNQSSEGQPAEQNQSYCDVTAQDQGCSACRAAWNASAQSPGAVRGKARGVHRRSSVGAPVGLRPCGA